MAGKIIPHSKPTLGSEEVKAVSGVIKSGYIAQGKKVKEFEEKLAKFFGVKGAVVTNSGTSALHLGLLALGAGPGDEVLLPSYVCTAPLNAVYAVGARPRLCDIEMESFNIDLGSINDNKKKNTKAVIVPHMFGNVADLEKIEETDLTIIEDCAHSIGAKYGKKKAGSIGKFSICSFYANKMMATGEGGALLSNDENVLGFANDLRDYDNREDYWLRYNYKMSDMQAAMGIAQLKKLPSFIKKRKEIAKKYDKAFNGLDVVLPQAEFDHIYYRYIVRTRKDLKSAIKSLSQKGIIAQKPVFNPLNRYLEMRSGFRNTEEVYNTALSLPIYPLLTGEGQNRVIKAVSECLA